MKNMFWGLFLLATAAVSCNKMERSNVAYEGAWKISSLQKNQNSPSETAQPILTDYDAVIQLGFDQIDFTKNSVMFVYKNGTKEQPVPFELKQQTGNQYRILLPGTAPVQDVPATISILDDNKLSFSCGQVVYGLTKLNTGATAVAQN